MKIITVKHCFNITVALQEKVGKNPLPVFTGVEEQKYINVSIYYRCSIKRLYLILAKEFELVLDPFMGSGTKGRVCDKLGTSFVGYDLRGY